MNPEPKIGQPVDPTKPAGPKWGDPGNPLPPVGPRVHGTLVDPAKPAGPKWGDEGYPLAPEAVPFVGLVGDVVTMKSGGPAMTVVGRSVPGEDPSLECQWFNPVDHTVVRQKFLISSLMLGTKESVWLPPVPGSPVQGNAFPGNSGQYGPAK